MPLYTIEITTAAERQLDKLEQPTRELIATAISGLAVTPRPSGCRKLAGKDRLWRLRVGRFRVLYRIDDGRLIVLVVKIGDRKDVYR